MVAEVEHFNPRAELERLRTRMFRTEPPVVVDGRVVLGGMWPGQRAWWDLRNEVQIFSAGYGSGKSNVLRKKVIAVSLANDGVPTSYTAPTYPMGRTLIAQPLAEDLAQQEKIRTALGQVFKWEWRKSLPNEFSIHHEFEARVADGSVRKFSRKALITVNSGEDPDKLKGTTLGAFAMEEPFIQGVGVYEQLMKRMRSGKARYRCGMLGGTPEGLGWGYDLAEGEMREKYDVGVVYASSFENLANPDNYATGMLRSLAEKAAASYVYGRFENLSTGLVYYAFNREDNVVDVAMPENAQIGLGLDFNVNPMAAVVFWYTTEPEPRIHFFDEIELPNSDTTSMGKLVLENYGTAGTHKPIAATRGGKFVLYATTKPLRDVWPDPSGKSRRTAAPAGETDFKILRSLGFEVHARSAAPAIRDRENAVNGMLRPVAGKLRMTIAPWCSKLIKYHLAYTHERKHFTEHKAMSHLLDARDYPVEFLFPMNRDHAKQLRLLGV